MDINKPKILLNMENYKQLAVAFILSVILTGIVCYIIFNNFFLTNSFAMEENINNFFTYFVKIGVIFIGVYFFSLSVVLHNKKSVKLLCYCYLTLLLFLFFIKGIYLDKPDRGLPDPEALIINFSILGPLDLDNKLNIIMPIPVYAILVYLLKNRKKAFIIGLIFIILIEPIQLITNFGNFAIDDSYHNTLGYLLGVLLYFIFYYIHKIKTDKTIN